MGIIMEPITANYAVNEIEKDLKSAFHEKGYGYHAAPNPDDAGVIDVVVLKEEGGTALAFHVAAYSTLYDNGYRGPNVTQIFKNGAVPGTDKSNLPEKHALLDADDVKDFVESVDRLYKDGQANLRNNLNKVPIFLY